MAIYLIGYRQEAAHSPPLIKYLLFDGREICHPIRSTNSIAGVIAHFKEMRKCRKELGDLIFETPEEIIIKARKVSSQPHAIFKVPKEDWQRYRSQI